MNNITNIQSINTSHFLESEAGQNENSKVQKPLKNDVAYNGTVSISTEGYRDMIQSKNGKNLYWTTDINQELPIKMDASGLAANIKPETLSQVFLRAAHLRGDVPAMRVMRKQKEYIWTWNQYYTDTLAFAKALHFLGVDERSCVNIMGFNSPEWAISFYGGILHNNVSSGIYTTNGAEACFYQSQHSKAQVVVVDTLEQLKLYYKLLEKLPLIKALVMWGQDAIPEDIQKDSRIYTFKNFLELGKDINNNVIDQIIQKQKPGTCACLIYTSGTTGNPKGVMLSHDNLVFNSSSMIIDILRSAPADMNLEPSEQRVVSYLPLSHIAGLQMDLTNHLIFGCQIYFAKPDALQGSLVETLQWARPTMFLAVPRVWEKFEEKLKSIAASKPQVLQSISGWAKGYGFQKVYGQQTGKQSPYLYSLANFLILKRIKEALGLDQTQFFFYGAAPLKQSSVDYFASLDIPLLNCYGLSETTGSTTVNYYSDFSLMHAGKQMSGSIIKISDQDEKEQGEIRIFGRHVMMGYLDNEQATLECIDENGFFRSGDQGRIDKGGFLKITGRIKELIITAGGENVAPVPIEDNFKLECPACSNIMLIGENQRFIGALITFKVDIDMKTGLPSRNLIQESINYFKQNAGVDVKTTDEAVKNKQIIELIEKCVNETNKKSVSKAAHIKKFKLLEDDFSQPGGELTPTMKLKRKVTEIKYQTLINEIYAPEAKL